MSDNIRELEMARRCFGYGRWDAPFWFIGPEQGKGPQEAPDNTSRVNAWFELGASELCDCRAFHHLIAEYHWHKDKPRLQPTWRPLILFLKTFLNESADQESLRLYQRDQWGQMESGETCLIELSGLAVKSSTEDIDRDRFRQERIETIRTKMNAFTPKFVVMYGVKDKASWEELSGCAFVPDDIVKVGCTLIAFAPHPNAHGRSDGDWVALGKNLLKESSGS